MMSICMYLFCPWFFLVIYLAFLMLDVWGEGSVSLEATGRRRDAAINTRSVRRRVGARLGACCVHAAAPATVQPRAGSAAVPAEVLRRRTCYAGRLRAVLTLRQDRSARVGHAAARRRHERGHAGGARPSGRRRLAACRAAENQARTGTQRFHPVCGLLFHQKFYRVSLEWFSLFRVNKYSLQSIFLYCRFRKVFQDGRIKNSVFNL